MEDNSIANYLMRIAIDTKENRYIPIRYFGEGLWEEQSAFKMCFQCFASEGSVSI